MKVAKPIFVVLVGLLLVAVKSATATTANDENKNPLMVNQSGFVPTASKVNLSGLALNDSSEERKEEEEESLPGIAELLAKHKESIQEAKTSQLRQRLLVPHDAVTAAVLNAVLSTFGASFRIKPIYDPTMCWDLT